MYHRLLVFSLTAIALLAACGSERRTTTPTNTPASTFTPTVTVAAIVPTNTPSGPSPSIESETEAIRQPAHVANIVDSNTDKYSNCNSHGDTAGARQTLSLWIQHPELL